MACHGSRRVCWCRRPLQPFWCYRPAGSGASEPELALGWKLPPPRGHGSRTCLPVQRPLPRLSSWWCSSTCQRAVLVVFWLCHGAICWPPPNFQDLIKFRVTGPGSTLPPPDLSSAAAAVSVPAFFIGLLVNLRDATVRVIMVRVASEAPRLRMTCMC